MMAVAFVGVPELSGRVTDFTATLGDQQVAALENKLAAFEAQKGLHIAVLIVPTTQPKDIAEFAVEVADLWKMGGKNIDDGILLIVAKDDQKVHLEVSYGLEGLISEAVARRVIAEIIEPHFKEGDFAGGIDAGIVQLIKLVDGDVLPVSPESRNEEPNAAALFILSGGLILGLLLSVLMRRILSGIVAALVSGALAVAVLGLSFWPGLLIAPMVFIIVATRPGDEFAWFNEGDFGGGGASGSW